MNGIVNEPSMKLPIGSIFAAFNWELWILWSLTYLVCVMLSVYYSAKQKQCVTKVSFVRSVLNYSFGILFEKRSRILWLTNSLRLIICFWSFIGKVACIIFAAYFVRYSTPDVKRKTLLNDFEGIQFAVESHGYRLVAISESHSSIQDLKSKLRRTFDKHPPEIVPENMSDYLLNNPKTFSYGEEHSVMELVKEVNYDSKLIAVPVKRAPVSMLTFGFRNDFPLSEKLKFTNLTRQLHSSGLLIRLLRKYGLFPATHQMGKKDKGLHGVPIRSLASPILFLVAAFGACVCTLVLECIVFNLYR